jgi:tetratricopeptide (TPR) repeat protein
LMGQTRQAEDLFRRAIRISSEDRTDRNVSPMVLNNLARTLSALERNVEAARYADQAYERARAAGDEMVINQSQLMRADLYRKLGDYKRTAEILTELEARFRRTLPAGHSAFAALYWARAALAQDQGDLKTAMAAADKAVASVEANTDHRELLPLYLRHRAEIELALQRIDAAKSDAARAIQLSLDSAALGAHSSYLGLTYLALGRALAQASQTEDARRAFTSAVEQLRPTLGDDHPQTKLALRLLTSTAASATR